MRKFFSIGLIIFLAVVNFNLLRDSFNTSKKLEEINAGQERIKEVEKQNESLKAELKLRESSYFIEQEARNRLDYGKAGETAIVLEGEVFSSNQEKNASKSKTNPEKWLDLIRN